MPIYLGGGIGPLRAYVRLDGRPRSSPEADAEANLIFGTIALVAFGAWVAVEGLQGRWGNIGRAAGIVFVVATVLSLVNRISATALLSSWAYFGLGKLGYFEKVATWFLEFNEGFEFGSSADQTFLWLVTAVLGLAGLAATVAAPPLAVGAGVHYLSGALLGLNADTKRESGAGTEAATLAADWQPPKAMRPFGALVHGWRRGIDFRTRASRSEFWFFLGMQLAVWLAIPITFRYLRPLMTPEVFDIYNGAGSTVFAWVGLVMPVPLLAAAVRRLHDLDLRGWWMLVPLAFPFVLVRPGTAGENRFG